jgi:hypothetical protein
MDPRPIDLLKLHLHSSAIIRDSLGLLPISVSLVPCSNVLRSDLDADLIVCHCFSIVYRYRS